MTSSYVIDASHVTLALGSGAARVEILRGIDLKVARGESVALLGPSGSGKSSLMGVLSGLERATSGAIRIAGADFTSLDEDDLARARRGRIGIVLQAFHLLPTMTAHENVAVPLELAGAPDPFPTAATELEAVGLGHRLTHYPAQLSGGEQQRVALARSLVREPQLLLADEPFGALDALTRIKMHGLLQDLVAAHRPAVLLVTHDVDEAIALADRIVVLERGRIATVRTVSPEVGSSADAAGHEALRRDLLAALGVEATHTPEPAAVGH